MPHIESLYHRLEVYQTRLLALKQNPCADIMDIVWYEKEINLIEAEIAVQDLLDEFYAQYAPPKIWVVTTDCSEIVTVLCSAANVIDLSIVWSWKSLKFLYRVEYITKPRKR